MFVSFIARIMRGVGSVPILAAFLRRQARRFREGSVVTIRAGLLSGLRWRRHHRYVSSYWLGTHELPLQEALARLLRSGDVFYDIGANAGFYTLLAGRLVGPQGRVYAFEPLPVNVESLREQIELNEMFTVEIVTTPVSFEEGRMEFSHSERDNSTAHLGPPRAPDERMEWIDVTTLDRFAAAHRMPTLVKIDVEGFEGQVLDGATWLLQHGTRFAIELHGVAPGAHVVRLLRSYGYRLECLDGSETDHPESEAYIIALPEVVSMERRQPESGEEPGRALARA